MEVYYHYTNPSTATEIQTTRVIAQRRGYVYVTEMPMSPMAVERDLFIGVPSKKGLEIQL